MKSIKKAKEPLNVDAAETQQKDVQTTLNAFRATAMKSADADIRKGAGSLFMGDAAGKKGEPTRKDRITSNIDKAKEKLAKLEQFDLESGYFDEEGKESKQNKRVKAKVAAQKRKIGAMQGALLPTEAGPMRGPMTKEEAEQAQLLKRIILKMKLNFRWEYLHYQLQAQEYQMELNFRPE